MKNKVYRNGWLMKFFVFFWGGDDILHLLSKGIIVACYGTVWEFLRNQGFHGGWDPYRLFFYFFAHLAKRKAFLTGWEDFVQ